MAAWLHGFTPILEGNANVRVLTGPIGSPAQTIDSNRSARMERSEKAPLISLQALPAIRDISEYSVWRGPIGFAEY
jgi:hypothetical protein